jgi:hypothetical protein
MKDEKEEIGSSFILLTLLTDTASVGDEPETAVGHLHPDAGGIVAHDTAGLPALALVGSKLDFDGVAGLIEVG